MTENLKIGILALQGDVREHRASLASCGASTRMVRHASDLVGLSGLVIPGGESTTMVNLLQAFEVWEPLAAALRRGLPVYGSCAGMIVLGSAVLDGRADQPCFGAIDIDVRRNAFGRQVASFEAAVELDGIEDGPVDGVFIRAPWIERAGPDVTVLGSTATPQGEVPVAARQGNVLVTSFHPEVTTDTRIHEYFLTMVQAAADSPAAETVE